MLVLVSIWTQMIFALGVKEANLQYCSAKECIEHIDVIS